MAAGAVAADAAPGTAEVAVPDSGKFTVRLTNFTGPFDLLLQLIGKHKLDVTEIALHQVTDDFIAYIRAMGDDWDLGETSEFLLVAATLLDLKAARLLPSAEVEDEEDLALLEARDLLFARLLQYKAYKEAAAVIADLEGIGARRWPRAVALEARYAEALPDLVLGIGPERLLKLALKQFLPKPAPPEVSIAHIHQVRVSVREHAALIRDRLRRAGSATFSLLIADCKNTLEVVARFLALLELYREGLVDFEQPVSLEEMTVRWIGGDDVEGDLDIDDYEGTPPEPDTAAMDPDDTDPDDPDAPARAAVSARKIWPLWAARRPIVDLGSWRCGRRAMMRLVMGLDFDLDADRSRRLSAGEEGPSDLGLGGPDATVSGAVAGGEDPADLSLGGPDVTVRALRPAAEDPIDVGPDRRRGAGSDRAGCGRCRRRSARPGPGRGAGWARTADRRRTGPTMIVSHVDRPSARLRPAGWTGPDRTGLRG